MFYYIGKTERNLQKRIKEHKNSRTSIYGNMVLKKTLLANKEAQPKLEGTKIPATPQAESSDRLRRLRKNHYLEIWR